MFVGVRLLQLQFHSDRRVRKDALGPRAWGARSGRRRSRRPTPCYYALGGYTEYPPFNQIEGYTRSFHFDAETGERIRWWEDVH